METVKTKPKFDRLRNVLETVFEREEDPEHPDTEGIGYNLFRDDGVVGYIESVNGPGCKAYWEFQPTHHELKLLAKYCIATSPTSISFGHRVPRNVADASAMNSDDFFNLNSQLQAKLSGDSDNQREACALADQLLAPVVERYLHHNFVEYLKMMLWMLGTKRSSRCWRDRHPVPGYQILCLGFLTLPGIG